MERHVYRVAYYRDRERPGQWNTARKRGKPNITSHSWHAGFDLSPASLFTRKIMWLKRRIRGLISNTMWQNFYATFWQWNTSTMNCITEMSRDGLRVYLLFYIYHCMTIFDMNNFIHTKTNPSFIFLSFFQYKKGNKRNEIEIRINEVELMPISAPNTSTNTCSSPSGRLALARQPEPLWLKPLMQGNLCTSHNSVETSELNGRGSDSWTSLDT